MLWWQRFFPKMDKAGEGSGGGGGGGTGGSGGGSGDGGKGGEGDKGGKSGDGGSGTVTLTKEQFDAIMARLPKDGGTGSGGGSGDGDLSDKARKEREQKDSEAANQRTLESALRFNLGGKEWLKTNAPLLPKNIEGIFEQAEKENYGSAVEKANAIKVGIVSEFFAQQANLDLLTPGLKSALEDFQKLTKNEKQARVQQIYDTVFEPAFEMLKRTKKAAELAKGHGSPSDSEAAYKERLMKASKKHYGMGDK